MRFIDADKIDFDEDPIKSAKPLINRQPAVEISKILQKSNEGYNDVEAIEDGKKFGIEEQCPFCGSEEIVIIEHRHTVGLRYSVFCCGCAAGIDPGWAQQRGQVVEMWNKRYK